MILDMSYFSNNNRRRPYEVAPIPGAHMGGLSLGEPQPKGKGISVTITMAIPFAKIYDILKAMYGSGQASAEDLQRAAEELRKVADQIEELATSIP